MNINRLIIAALGSLVLIGLVGAVAAADQTAFNGPHTIPGRIQAEDYDNGGAGIAYSDTTSGNSGGAGRTTEGVDVETVNGVTNIGWVIDGEWTEYTVSVGATGSYTANFRVGSWANSRQVVLTVDGATGCTITVPNTGSYEAFQTVSAPLALSAGTHVIRLTCLGSGQNIDWFEIAAGATTVPVTNPTVVPTQVAGQTPYNGVHTLPGRVQAEDFDNGGQNVAYYDTTSGNSGGAGRTAEAVDVETVNGVTNIGWIIAGEWTEYTVNVATSGSYTANFRVGSWANSRQVVLTVDGATGCTITVPNTGSSEAYQTVSAPLSLTAGTHVIRLTYLVSGQNIDWFEITGGATTIVPTTAPTSMPTAVPTTIRTTAPTIAPTTAPTQASGQAPYNGVHALPGRIQTEDFDTGGQNVAYYDSTIANIAVTNSIAYRPAEAVDAETAPGIGDICWIDDGEWTEYTVNVAASGSYIASFRAGSWTDGHSIVLTVDGAPGCTVAVPNLGAYDTYTTISAPLTLTAGTHVIRLTFQGAGQIIDWFAVTGGSTTIVPTTAPTAVPTTVRTTVPTTAPTVVPTTVKTVVPTTAPTAVPTTLGGAPSQSELASRASSAYSAGTSRVSSMQSAYRAWSIPAPSTSGAINAKSNSYSNLAGNGGTDDSAALQALINAVPAGSRIYFPAATYVFNAGGININKQLTLLGASGTVFACGASPADIVFYLNRQGTPSSVVSGIVISGITFEGGGEGDSTTIIRANNCNSITINHIKMHNVGHTGIAIRDCDDTVVEQSVFDNVYQSGWGYSLWVMERSDRTIFRNNFCVTKGRHFVTVGPSASGVSVTDYTGDLLVENNYFEYSTNDAVNAHETDKGPFRVKNNVFYKCNQAACFWNGKAEITDNVVIDAVQGFDIHRTYFESNSLPTWSGADLIARNTLTGISMDAIRVERLSFTVQDNIVRGTGGSPGIQVQSTIDGAGHSSSTISGNVMESVSTGVSASSLSGVTKTNNWLNSGGTYRLC